jgi:hypothetical protein
MKQLPVSVNSWQHGSQIFFATFIQLIMTKLQQAWLALKTEKNKHRLNGHNVIHQSDIQHNNARHNGLISTLIVNDTQHNSIESYYAVRRYA